MLTNLTAAAVPEIINVPEAKPWNPETLENFEKTVFQALDEAEH